MGEEPNTMRSGWQEATRLTQQETRSCVLLHGQVLAAGCSAFCGFCLCDFFMFLWVKPGLFYGLLDAPNVLLHVLAEQLCSLCVRRTGGRAARPVTPRLSNLH